MQISVLHQSGRHSFAGLRRRFSTMANTVLRLTLLFGLALGTLTLDGLTGLSHAQSLKRGPSGLPLPRFVSLKAKRVNLRVGPGRDYAVDWLYLKPGLPMEIIQEYDNWRRVRDADGTEGWIYQSLLSGRRTAVVAPWKRRSNPMVELFAERSAGARQIAKMQPGVIGMLHSCDGNWCEMSVSGHRGWILQSKLWGAYPDETVEE